MQWRAGGVFVCIKQGLGGISQTSPHRKRAPPSGPQHRNMRLFTRDQLKHMHVWSHSTQHTHVHAPLVFEGHTPPNPGKTTEMITLHIQFPNKHTLMQTQDKSRMRKIKKKACWNMHCGDWNDVTVMWSRSSGLLKLISHLEPEHEHGPRWRRGIVPRSREKTSSSLLIILNMNLL